MTSSAPPQTVSCEPRPKKPIIVWAHPCKMCRLKTAASMISQTKSCRIRSESNPKNWRTKRTHFWELQKGQNSKAGTALDKILFRFWYLCWKLTIIPSNPRSLTARKNSLPCPSMASLNRIGPSFGSSRTHLRLDRTRYRRMSKDYEHRVQTSETLIDLIAIRLMLNRLTKS